jgi:hypothetical protein
MIEVGSDAKEWRTKSPIALECATGDSSDGSEIRTRFQVWSAVAEVVIFVVVVVVGGVVLLLAVVANTSLLFSIRAVLDKS